ncbi:MAG: PilZ domain-containing protein [Betaproteobacteria bacterium]|nr:PilZ domain-containing protein [Betaproteobacteria bacterium]MDH3437654.1 PilZ domain-containing protein [Betaproteobacteria bacterium]
MTQPQKRRDQRVDTALLVFLENVRGVTRDVSASGAFFWTSGTYAPGESISFAIELKTAGGRMMRKCQGAVVRTETLAHMVGVAARITESTMESA